MIRWKLSARIAALVVIATAAGASGAAQKAAKHKEAAPAAEQQEPVAAPAPATSMGYGVRLGGFFTDQHKQVAKRSFAQYYAKNKTCPKDMERQGKTCKALVQGHYWAVGQSLQKAVETFPVPDEVKAKLPPAPQGYEYVRAGDDILLMSSGIHLVVDVMQDVAAG
jgi:Ni/Co efflux regulator RcnB